MFHLSSTLPFFSGEKKLVMIVDVEVKVDTRGVSSVDMFM